MNTRWLRLAVLTGLGAVAGAVLPARMCAQVPVKRDTVSGRRDTLPTRVDSAAARRRVSPTAGRDTIIVPLPARADSMLRNDSTMKGIVPVPPVEPPRDTMKAPLARAEAPPVLEIGAPRIYDRSAMFATGAVTLGDLLGRVPGLTEFAAGAAAAPGFVASQGDARRIRVFLDGLELDPMDLRAQGLAPVSDLPLHALEELRIERGAEEVRVYARSWRVDRTDPYTRADIFTGDQATDLYRAFYGRRYAHGEALQVAAEQYNTQPNRSLGSTDGSNVMGRFGLARSGWSADLFAERSTRNRARWTGDGPSSLARDTVPEHQARRTTAYLRLGAGDPDGSPRWLQLIASAHDYRASSHSAGSTARVTPSAADTAGRVADSTAYESQYLVTGGVRRGPFRASVAERLRVGGDRTSHVLSGRASLERGLLSLSLLGEGRSYLHPSRLEATARFAPLARIALTGSVSRTGTGGFDRVMGGGTSARAVADTDATIIGVDSAPVNRFLLAARTNSRAEAGVRIRDLWLSAGLLQRGATTLLPPAELGLAYSSGKSIRHEASATATTIAARGRLYRAINVDAWALKWSDSTGLYRPQYQTRAELYVQTSLLERFPKGNFGLLASLAHEYRSSSRFASGDTIRVAEGFRTVAFRLEVRIASAVVSYQFRNLLQERYAQVPGFTMPRQTQFYGVRWDFWN